MTEDSSLITLAGKVGELRGEMTGVNQKIADVKASLEAHQTTTNARFDGIDGKLDLIQEGITKAASRRGAFLDLGRAGWSVVTVAVLAFGEAVYQNWSKITHFFGS